MKTTTLIVGRCPKDGHYSTVLDTNLIINKHYDIDEIRRALEGKDDYSLACARTKSYWRSWYRKIWKSVVAKICRYLGHRFSKNEVATSLQTFLRECQEGWLQYVLDLVYIEFNNLCIFLSVVSSTVVTKGKSQHLISIAKGKGAPKRAKKPP